jgi:hypothetical protein
MNRSIAASLYLQKNKDLIIQAAQRGDEDAIAITIAVAAFALMAAEGVIISIVQFKSLAEVLVRPI